MLIAKKFVFLFVAMFVLSTRTTGGQENASTKKDSAVKVHMRNIRYHFTDQVIVHIAELRGELVPSGENEFPIFDDRNSFRVRISGAEIAISTASLANVLNSYVLTANKAPLKNVSIEIDKGRLKVKGKLRKGEIPFETDGTLNPTPDGKIRLHAEKIKALHLPAKGLMELLGIEMSDFLKAGKVAGYGLTRMICRDPRSNSAAPHIEGAVTAIRLEGGNIVQVFGTAANKSEERDNAGNYMAYRGNRLRFGKLTMNDADMTLIDMDPRDPFDFYLDHYREQLTAGYTRITPTFGLRVFMKDFEKLGRTPRRQPADPNKQ